MVSCTDQPSAGVSPLPVAVRGALQHLVEGLLFGHEVGEDLPHGHKATRRGEPRSGRQGVEVVDQGPQSAQAATVEVEAQAGQVGLVAVFGLGGAWPRSPRSAR